jgi:hypothetical protein
MGNNDTLKKTSPIDIYNSFQDSTNPSCFIEFSRNSRSQINTGVFRLSKEASFFGLIMPIMENISINEGASQTTRNIPRFMLLTTPNNRVFTV